MTDASQTRISLRTSDGKTGYRIVKFQTMPKEPHNKTQESVIKVHKAEVRDPSLITGVVDFSDLNLLAVAIFKQHDTASITSFVDAVVFDNEIFNQDIFITNYDAATGESMNFYLELEVIELGPIEQTIATLQSIRSSAQGTGQKS